MQQTQSSLLHQQRFPLHKRGAVKKVSRPTQLPYLLLGRSPSQESYSHSTAAYCSGGTASAASAPDLFPAPAMGTSIAIKAPAPPRMKRRWWACRLGAVGAKLAVPVGKPSLITAGAVPSPAAWRHWAGSPPVEGPLPAMLCHGHRQGRMTCCNSVEKKTHSSRRDTGPWEQSPWG